MKFPLLLTVAEPKSLYHHYHDERGTTDVWKASYVQADELGKDRLQGLTRVSVYKGVEEYAIGWKDSRTCWIRRESETLLVPPELPVEPPEEPAQEAISASGRYRWRVNKGDCGPTHLEQLDQQTGESRVLWSHARWAGVQMASDPNRDRLLWSYSGYHLRGGLNSWDPQGQSNQPLEMPFQDDFDHLSFSPTGEAIAFVHQNEVYTHRLDETGCRRVSDLKQESKHLRTHTYRLKPRWSPDGKRIFYTNFSFDWRGDFMMERYNLMAALPDGSQRRLMLEQPAVREVVVGPPLKGRTAEPE
ncbi:PD40 domain-containing protein [bacterium]|nr:PD40 domain-containing protein [bacterium]